MKAPSFICVFFLALAAAAPGQGLFSHRPPGTTPTPVPAPAPATPRPRPRPVKSTDDDAPPVRPRATPRPADEDDFDKLVAKKKALRAAEENAGGEEMEKPREKTTPDDWPVLKPSEPYPEIWTGHPEKAVIPPVPVPPQKSPSTPVPEKALPATVSTKTKPPERAAATPREAPARATPFEREKLPPSTPLARATPAELPAPATARATPPEKEKTLQATPAAAPATPREAGPKATPVEKPKPAEETTPSPKPKVAETPAARVRMVEETPVKVKATPELRATPRLARATLETAPGSGEPDDPAQAAITFFAALRKNQIEEAYTTLVKGSRIAEAPEEVRTLKSKTAEALELFGPIHGYELIESKAIGSNLLRRTYISLGRDFPLRWRFYFYRPASQWRLLDLRVDDRLNSIFEEPEDRIPAEKNP